MLRSQMKNDQEKQRLEKIVRLMQRDDSVDTPADSIKWARNLFRTRAAEPKTSLVQKVLAVLQMDITPGKAAFGERSASASAVRQMLFDAGEYGVDLRIQAAKKGSNIQGQILGHGFAGGTVKLFGPTFSAEAEIGEMSEFKFEEVPVGEYSLSIENSTDEIVIEAFKVD